MFVVKCREFTSSPRSTREAAERLKAAIEELGSCKLTHTIVEVE